MDALQIIPTFSEYWQDISHQEDVKAYHTMKALGKTFWNEHNAWIYLQDLVELANETRLSVRADIKFRLDEIMKKDDEQKQWELGLEMGATV